MSQVPVDEQVRMIMNGSEFGDPALRDFMANELRDRLIQAEREGKGLRVYAGYDVTGPDLHLGHTVTMRKLRQFQDLGRDVTFVIGTFTTLIGDASDRLTARTIRSAQDVERDARGYTDQAFRILDRGKTHVRNNSEWLAPLRYEDLIQFASLFTIQQFLTRENFKLRYERGDGIPLREFLYPLAQGYDAVALRADVQIGATEQLFNLMAGRKLQEYFGQPPQVCITFPILVGTEGKMRMSKSTGNYIGIAEDPEMKYGKIMSLPDEALGSYADLLTRWSVKEIDEFKSSVANGSVHPMEAKKRLAWEIVSSLDGDVAADEAAEHFARVHQRHELPLDMPEMTLHQSVGIIDLLIRTGMAHSKSEARRLIDQGGVKLNAETLTSPDRVVEPVDQIMQVGRRRFLHIVPSKERRP